MRGKRSDRITTVDLCSILANEVPICRVQPDGQDGHGICAFAVVARVRHCLCLGVMLRGVALLLALCATVAAQDGQAQLRDRAASLVAMGKYTEAEPLLTRVLAMREKDAGPEDLTLVPTIEELAAVYRAQGRNADAE